MQININVSGVADEKLEKVLAQLEKIMATQQDLVAEVATIKIQLVKIGTETGALLDKITTLTNIIDAGGSVTPELQAAVDDLKSQAQVVDDLVPDAPPPAPAP